jgi:ParB/RepB/Spo0J family partition protein
VTTATETKKITKKKAPVATKKPVVKKATPATAKKTIAKKGVMHIARTPEQVVAEQTGQTFHGAALSQGNVKKATKGGILSFLSLKQIQVMPDFNPRNHPGPVDDLVQTIKSEGMLSSMVVRPSTTPNKFDLIAGERRFKAAKIIDPNMEVPCIIRADLIGDDERALAVAVAENSEDGRTNLNMVELGHVFKKLEKKGWAIAKIAKETGVHAQRVRRALTLIETPDEVQKKIAAGEWSVAAGLEYARLDEPTRKSIKAKVGATTTADDIRKLRKAAERDADGAKIAKGETPKTTKAGTISKKSPITAWRKPTEIQEELQEACYTFLHADADEVESPDWYELRGTIATLLWLRGDRSVLAAPDLEPGKDSDDYAAQVKDLAVLKAAIKAEASKYTPPQDGETNGDKAEG